MSFKFKVFIWIVRDLHGNKANISFDNMLDIVTLMGLKDFDGNEIVYQSDVSMLEDWCEAHGLTVDKFDLDLGFVDIIGPMLKVM